jgi:hypothetical protein
MAKTRSRRSGKSRGVSRKKPARAAPKPKWFYEAIEEAGNRPSWTTLRGTVRQTRQNLEDRHDIIRWVHQHPLSEVMRRIRELENGAARGASPVSD